MEASCSSSSSSAAAAAADAARGGGEGTTGTSANPNITFTANGNANDDDGCTDTDTTTTTTTTATTTTTTIGRKAMLLLPTRLSSSLSTSTSTSTTGEGEGEGDEEDLQHPLQLHHRHRHHHRQQQQEAELESGSNDCTITQIQATSLLVSFWRWKESQSCSESSPLLSAQDGRADGILLQKLLSPQQLSTLEQTYGKIQKGIDAMALRTRYIDDWVVSNVLQQQKQHQQQQKHQQLEEQKSSSVTVINLGAGVDPRPYRLKGLLDNCLAYVEVDSDKSILELKHQVLTDNMRQSDPCLQNRLLLLRVGADLCQPQQAYEVIQQTVEAESRSANNPFPLLTPETDVIWIAEGLLAYLEPQQRSDLLKMTFEKCCPRSKMVMTVLDVDGAHNFESMGLKIPWKQLSKTQEIQQIAIDAGWTNVNIITFDELYTKYCMGGDQHKRPVLDLTGYCLMTLEK